MKNLGRFSEIPRTRLWKEPTPLELLPNLSTAIGAKEVWVKRDDCNGLAFGGNKVRQMEYYLGDASAQGADTLLITGAVQSNFVRTAAAACAKHGFQCHVQLEKRVENESAIYNSSGNVLLDRMFGALVHEYPEGEDEEGADKNLELIATELRKEGRKPYIVHLHPSHKPFGALGYVDCAIEISEQLDESGVTPDMVYVPSGSGNTHGGLLYGLRAVGNTVPVKGICVRRSVDLQRPRIAYRLEQIADLLETTSAAQASDVDVDDQFLAPGYGMASSAVKEAISLAATKEALILDPVYTGKAFAAIIDHSRKHPGGTYLFIHTGGGPAIFAYGDAMLNYPL